MRISRIKDLEQHILKKQHVTLDQLCETFQISKSTLRRDIDNLCKHGVIRKIYGGVTVNTPENGRPPFQDRIVKNPEEKRRVALKASELVNDGDIIFIDSGTTTQYMIDYLLKKENITIVTNNLAIINGAVPHKTITLVGLSGVFDRRLNAFAGASAAMVLQQYNVTKAFMATAGFSTTSGVTHSFYAESEVKALAVQRSREVILLADSSKAGAVSLYTYCTFDQVNTLISDRKLGAEYMEIVSRFGGRFMLAEEDA